jgi:hypothetical protein
MLKIRTLDFGNKIMHRGHRCIGQGCQRGGAFYSDLYGETAPQFGMTALADQQMGAGLMMITDVVMMMTILGVFFVAAAADGERKDAARTAAMQAGQDRN